ncbi:MAG: sialate O-acetylesterase [Planctomycetota bacterium]
MPRLLFALVVLYAVARAQQPSAPVSSELALMSLFSDHMVLPASTTVVVKGRAQPGAEVVLHASWRTEPVTGRADGSGRFGLPIDTPAAANSVRFHVESGTSTRAVEDVLVGDVWLASGQSNMEMSLGPSPTAPNGAFDWEKESEAATLPELRLFTVARKTSATPLEDVEGRWEVCTPATARAFSATGFFFARDLLLRRRLPIGIVASSWGGTICEAWTRKDGLVAFPEFAPAIAQLEAAPRTESERRERSERYWDEIGIAAPTGAEGTWASATLPHIWSKHGAGDFDGIGWYRRDLEIEESWIGRDLVLMLGAIDDMDAVWVGSQKVAGTFEPGHWNEPRQYRIAKDMVTSTKLELRIAVLDTGGEGGIAGSAEACRLQPADGEGGSLALDAKWSFHRGSALRDLPPFPDAARSNPNQPTLLWNAMIAPLVPFPFTGAIWYQGESNRDRALQYSTLFPAMIRDWRAAFERELPFLFVQIAPFGYQDDQGELFALRLAQAEALSLPKVGMAVTTDIGDARDIHPRQKRLVGERLSMAARRLVHGDTDPSLNPPMPRSAVRRGSEVVLTFDGVVGPWRTTGTGPSHFEVAGEDAMFHTASARAEGAAIVLRAAAVAAPKHVRYAFHATAMADSWDEHGLPLPPFLLAVELATEK